MLFIKNESQNHTKTIRALFILSGVLLLAAAFFSLLHFYVEYEPAQAGLPPENGAHSFAGSETPQGTAEPLVASNKFFPGISIEGVSVSGLTKEQARQELSPVLDSLSAITLEYGENSWQSAGYIGISNNLDEVIDAAYAIGRSGNEAADKAAIEGLTASPVNFELMFGIESFNAEALADKINGDAGTRPVNAGVESYTKKDGFVFSEGKAGKSADTDALLWEVGEAVRNRQFSVPVTVPMKEEKPEIFAADMAERYVLMAEFSTIAKNDSARNTNIALALEQFNGMIVPQGKQVSFNKTTGERTVEKGYLSAGVIVNGVSAEDVGGGICQVSSTLFNAVIRAGLQIDVRNPHSWPSEYIGAGQDAMVDWPSSDFAFTNTSQSDVYIVTEFVEKERKLVVRIFGVPVYEPGVVVELRTEQYEDIPQPQDRITVDELLPPGELFIERKGRAGSRWNTYLQFFDKDGNLIEEKYAFNSVYRAIATKINVGPGTSVSPSATPALSGSAQAQTPAPPSGVPSYTIKDGKIVFDDPSFLEEPGD